MEFTSVKNLPLKSWRQRRWFLLSAISIFPMLQWKTNPIHFLPKILDVPHAAMGNRACTFSPQVVIRDLSTASPAGSLKQPGPDPLWPNMLTPLVARSKMYTLIKTCR